MGPIQESWLRVKKFEKLSKHNGTLVKNNYYSYPNIFQSQGAFLNILFNLVEHFLIGLGDQG